MYSAIPVCFLIYYQLLVVDKYSQARGLLVENFNYFKVGDNLFVSIFARGFLSGTRDVDPLNDNYSQKTLQNPDVNLNFGPYSPKNGT